MKQKLNSLVEALVNLNLKPKAETYIQSKDGKLWSITRIS